MNPDPSSSPSPDEPRSLDAPDNEKKTTAFWPLLLLASSVAILMLMQLIYMENQRRTLLQTYQARATALSQTQVLQQRLNSIMQELIQLSASNEDAKAIVRKYNIRINTPAAPDPTVDQP